LHPASQNRGAAKKQPPVAKLRQERPRALFLRLPAGFATSFPPPDSQ
jgi:hypothetical protein